MISNQILKAVALTVCLGCVECLTFPTIPNCPYGRWGWNCWRWSPFPSRDWGNWRMPPRDDWWPHSWFDGAGDFRLNLKKRSAHLSKDRFYLRIEANPCQFLVYDRNSDGLITMEEVKEVFHDYNLAEKLIRDLDITTGDNVVTRDEFNFMAPKIIYGCGQETSTPAPGQQQSQQSESNESAIDQDSQDDETSEDDTQSIR